MRIFILFIVSIFIICFFNECDNENTNSPLVTPTVNFLMDKPVLKKGEVIRFTNKSIDASSYLWDFGDGNTSTDIDPIHTYSNTGLYNVTLTATNEAGIRSRTRDVFIKDITVMTYNIAFSAGAVENLYNMWQTDGHGAWNHDRRPELLKIIRSVDPDILGIQEAFSWFEYEPKVYKRFADSLGMKYCYFPEFIEAEWNGIAIYSKFPIESTSLMKHQPCVTDQIWNGTFMVEAVIRIDNEKLIDVLVCHIIPHDDLRGVITCEVETLYKKLQSSFKTYTIMMGDMNVAGGPPFSRYFSEAGLYCGDLQFIDQIWASSKLFKKSKTIGYSYLPDFLSPDIYNLLSEASDHKPVIEHFAF
jgi:PKD repeat protein